MANPSKRNALGRGLDALISMDDAPARGSSAISDIPLDRISPNPEQPRRSFDEEALQELATSIRELGIIQPLSLRKISADSYQIIAGERRFKAAKLAGLDKVPAYIRSASDVEITEMALIENVQREDLNPIEIALAFRKLIDQYKLTQEKLSERIGKKRATIANFLRLLKLPAEVQLGLQDKQVDMGHARAILSIEKPSLQLKLYKETIKHGLSVRKVEELAKAYQSGDGAKDNTGEMLPATPKMSPNLYKGLRDHLSQAFNTPVQFSCDKSGKGKITFQFNGDDELMRLISLFDSMRNS